MRSLAITSKYKKCLVMSATLLPVLVFPVLDVSDAFAACYRLSALPHYCGVTTEACPTFCEPVGQCDNAHGSIFEQPVPWTESAPPGANGKSSVVNSPNQVLCTINYYCTEDSPEYCGTPPIRRKCETDEGREFARSYINPPIPDGSNCTG